MYDLVLDNGRVIGMGDPVGLPLKLVKSSDYARLPGVVTSGDGLAHGSFLHQRTQGNQVLKILPAEGWNLEASLTDELNEPFTSQPVKRLPQRAGSHLVTLGQFFHRKAGLRGERTADDVVPQLIKNVVGEGRSFIAPTSNGCIGKHQIFNFDLFNNFDINHELRI